MKKPFNEIFATCPDGLHVSYRNDENYVSVQDSGGVVVRQSYPFKSRGLHECEATRGKVAMRELSRSIKSDGTVIKVENFELQTWSGWLLTLVLDLKLKFIVVDSRSRLDAGLS